MSNCTIIWRIPPSLWWRLHKLQRISQRKRISSSQISSFQRQNEQYVYCLSMEQLPKWTWIIGINSSFLHWNHSFSTFLSTNYKKYVLYPEETSRNTCSDSMSLVWSLKNRIIGIQITIYEKCKTQSVLASVSWEQVQIETFFLLDPAPLHSIQRSGGGPGSSGSL